MNVGFKFIKSPDSLTCIPLLYRIHRKVRKLISTFAP